MATVNDKMKGISLHGLGFIQVHLPNETRLHVWHPELPRRRCFEHSCIHDHRFSFESRVLVGVLENVIFRHTPAEDGEYMSYLHEGARLSVGSRPWVPDGRLNLEWTTMDAITVGRTYFMKKYAYHRSRALGNGKVATLMTKTSEQKAGAHSLCRFGVEPDVAFDRYQLSPAQLWEVVADVLGGSAVDAVTTSM